MGEHAPLSCRVASNLSHCAAEWLTSTGQHRCYLQQLARVLDACLLGGTNGAATLANVVECHILYRAGGIDQMGG